jgi:serine protease Do
LKLPDQRGVEVTAVEEGSPAQSAGLKTGDVLLTYNGENIVGGQQLGRLVHETPPGRRIKIEYWREGKIRSVMVVTGAPPHRLAPVPPNFIGFDVPPQFRMMQIPEIPTPFLVWRSPLFGLVCEGIDSQLAHYFGVSRGVLVRSVVKDSVADKAGIKAGDVLTKLGDRTLASPRDLTSYLRIPHGTDKAVPLELMRDHRSMTINIPVPEAPEQ